MATCWIIAGPNGAGKTTFALRYLPTLGGCQRFINADLIAAGLSPLAPERELAAAGRLFLQKIEDAMAEGEDFAFETTLAGRGYLRLITKLRAEFWRVELVYLALPSAELSSLRVAERVAHGGHDIPSADIARRFPRSLRNLLHNYAARVDRTRCFLNSGLEPELIFTQSGAQRVLADIERFEHLFQESQK